MEKLVSRSLPNHSVYVIREIGTGTVKIGKTRGNPQGRLRELQTGCPYQLELIAVLSPNEHPGEKVLHARCAQWRIRAGGEWFWGTDGLYEALAIRRPRTAAV